jgi:hypothetical protein
MAVFMIESSGNFYENGRMIIRFENHKFLEKLIKEAGSN